MAINSVILLIITKNGPNLSVWQPCDNPIAWKYLFAINLIAQSMESGLGGESIDFTTCFVFSLTQVPVVHWILRVGSRRLNVSKCCQLLAYDMEAHSRLWRCVLHCVHLCVLWMFMCMFYVLYVVSIDMLVISLVYTHLLITQNVSNLFLRMIIFIVLYLCSVPGWVYVCMYVCVCMCVCVCVFCSLFHSLFLNI